MEDGLRRRVVVLCAKKSDLWFACEVIVWSKHVDDIAVYSIGDAVCFTHAWIKVDYGVVASLSDVGRVVFVFIETKSSVLSSQWDGVSIGFRSVRCLSLCGFA